MTRWNCLVKLPSELKDALAEHWLSPRITVKGAMAEWISRRWCNESRADQCRARKEAVGKGTKARRHGATKGAIRAPSGSAGLSPEQAEATKGVGPASPATTGGIHAARMIQSARNLKSQISDPESFIVRALVPATIRRAVASSLSAVASWLIAATANGQCPTPGFTGLGDLPGGADSSTVHALSADGTTAVGYSVSGSGTEAFRWRSNTGMVGLGDLPGGGFASYAGQVSADGSVIAGWGASASASAEAFVWRESDGLLALGFPPESSGIVPARFLKLCHGLSLSPNLKSDKDFARLADILFLHGFLPSRDAF